MISIVKKLSYLAIFLLLANTTNASHAGMMDLTYRHVSGTTYEFTLVFYRNCLGSTASAPGTIMLRAESSSLSVSVINAASLSQLPHFGPQVPPLQPSNFLNCTSTSTCWEEYVYRGVLNLSNLSTTPYARDWEFSYEICCFPGGAAAPDNMTSGYVRAECGLNNQDFSNNDAPFWHDRRPVRPGHLQDTVINYPGESICVGVLNNLDLSVVDYEGDLVKYELIPVKDQGGTNATYISSFSSSVPMPYVTPPGFEIDSFTGNIPVIANTTLAFETNFYIAVKATEFRYDTVVIGGVFTPVLKEIGYVCRNFLVIQELSSTCPGANIEILKKNRKLRCKETSFDIEISDKFKCQSADQDGSFVLLKNVLNGDTTIPDSVSVLSCFANSISKKLRVHLKSPLIPGDYHLMMQTGVDGNTLISECGTEIAALQDTLFIEVDTVNKAKVIPTLDTTGAPLPYFLEYCGATTIGIKFDTPIKCSSINLGGKEFSIFNISKNPPVPQLLSSITIANCSKGFTDSLNLNFFNPLIPGEYTLDIIKSLDGNTFLNECEEETTPTSFSLIVEPTEMNLGPDLVYCKDSVFNAVIGPASGFASYNWNTGQKDSRIEITTKGTYILEAINAKGCKAIDTVIVTEIDCGTGIADHNSSTFKAFPIPTDKTLKLVNEGNKSFRTISVLDQSARVVKSKLVTDENGVFLIDVSEVSNGNYFIKVEFSDGSAEAQKFVIIH